MDAHQEQLDFIHKATEETEADLWDWIWQSDGGYRGSKRGRPDVVLKLRHEKDDAGDVPAGFATEFYALTADVGCRGKGVFDYVRDGTICFPTVREENTRIASSNNGLEYVGVEEGHAFYGPIRSLFRAVGNKVKAMIEARRIEEERAAREKQERLWKSARSLFEEPIGER